MKKYLKLFLAMPIVLTPLAASVACFNSDSKSLKYKTPVFLEKFQNILKENNLTLSEEQINNAKNFNYEAFEKLNNQLSQNANRVFQLQKELNEHYSKEKEDQIQELINQNTKLLSQNILSYFEYMYYFKTKFYDYALLTKHDSIVKHSPRYLHWAANVQNEFSSSNEALHQHFKYVRSDVKPDILFKDLSASKLINSPKKQGYKVLYLSLNNSIFKIYISNKNEILLDSEMFYFCQATAKINPDEALERMEKDPYKLTSEDINKFEEKFAALPDIKYPQKNLIY
ncbi:hypothetical protein [Mycoplasma seminis]|uniref:Lipoprotein n=1 Tax=Mycoplasma seminis TaxID=512749 RepID=A0ABY9HBI2_9MOLU|nr:hypothetical protein [Mycoplasma seminis]WLP85924.1 hypothetical protein Q8852_02145 [Mycoplasma seminis]